MLISYQGTASTLEDATVLAVSGDIDIYTAPDFSSDLHAAMAAADGGLIVDLSAVAFIDSSGLGVLIGLLRRLTEQQRALVLVLGGPRLSMVFAITGLDRTFDIAASRDEAWAIMRPPRRARA